MRAKLPAETGSVVRDGRDGFVIPAGDSARLAARLRELHAQPRLREAKRRAVGAERALGGHVRRQPHVSGQAPILLSAY